MKPAEEYILNQEEPFKSILMHVQILIEHTFPEIDLRYKWRMPCYYFGTRPFCYLRQAKDYVDVAFWHSAHLSSKFDKYLISENRKVIKSLRYKTLEEIEDDVFVMILKEVETYKNKSFFK
ncbi:MAG: DUF1801 domain-containing protein [Aquaticitalea sp.]